MHRRTASKRLVTDGRLLGEIDQLRETLRLAQIAERFNSQGLADQTPRLEQQLNELTVRAADESLLVIVEALPADEFDSIARRHPPSTEQLDRYQAEAKAIGWAAMPEWNDRTMAPDLLQACLTEPEWSDGFWAELSRGAQNQLWNLAMSVQVAGADLPFFSAATASINGGGVLSTSAVNGDSPSASS